MQNTLDVMDLKIIRSLLRDGRVPYSSIAKELNISDVAVKKRVEKLMARGVIKTIRAELDYGKIGYKYVFFVEVKPEPSEATNIYRRLLEHPAVVEVHFLVGEYPVLAKVLAENVDGIRKFVEWVAKTRGVLDMRTAISLEHDERGVDLPSNIIQSKLG